MGLGFFRDLDIVEMGLGIFEGSKVERGRELSPFLGFLLCSNFGLYSK